MANRYILFFKPFDVLSSFTDPEGRPTLGTYVSAPGVYAAGRLDQDSEGLMLLTDDGRFAHVLTDPQHKLPKTYFVQVENEPDKSALVKLRRGVLVKGEVTMPADVDLLDDEPDLPPRATPIRYRPSIPTRWLRMVLREGRKRQIRHMTAAVGHPTLRLVRVAIGPLTLRGLQPGQWRDLTPEELDSLRNALGFQPGGVSAPSGASNPGAGRARPNRTSGLPRARGASRGIQSLHVERDGPDRTQRRPPARPARKQGPRPNTGPVPERRQEHDQGDRTQGKPPVAGDRRGVGQRPKSPPAGKSRPIRRDRNKT